MTKKLEQHTFLATFAPAVCKLRITCTSPVPTEYKKRHPLWSQRTENYVGKTGLKADRGEASSDKSIRVDALVRDDAG